MEEKIKKAFIASLAALLVSILINVILVVKLNTASDKEDTQTVPPTEQAKTQPTIQSSK